jgi:hypothetical protein
MVHETEKEQQFSHLKLIRDKNNFTNVPFFSDENLKQILDSIEGYHQIYQQSSEATQRLLFQEDFFKNFLLSVLGVYPTLFFAQQTEENVYAFFPYGEDILETDNQEEIILELEELVSKHLPKLTVIKIDQKKVKNHKGFFYEIVNIPSLNRVFKENQDLFQNNKNPVAWLIEEPEKGTMAPSGKFKDITLGDIRAGLISGFPRKDCEIFAEKTANAPIVKMVFKSMINGLLGKEDGPRWKEPPFENLNELRAKVGYHFVVFTEEGYEWIKAADNLINELESMGMIKNSKKPKIS